MELAITAMYASSGASSVVATSWTCNDLRVLVLGLETLEQAWARSL